MENRPSSMIPAEQKFTILSGPGTVDHSLPRPSAARPETPKYLLALRRRFWVLIVGAVLGGVAGGIVLLTTVPSYEAAATVEIAGLNSVRTHDMEVPGGGLLQPDLLEQFRVITSTDLLGRAAERLRLETSPINPPSAGIASKLRTRLGFLPSDPTTFTRDAIQMGIYSVNPKPLGSPHIFMIDCISMSAEIAAAAANSIAAEYIAQNQQFHSGSANKAAEWLAGQVQEAKSQMDDADAKLQAFIKSEGLKFVLDQNTLDNSKLRTLQADLSTMQADRIEKESRYNLAKSSPPDSLPEILDDEVLQGLKAQIVGLRQQRALLLATLTPEHYKVKRIDNQIEETERSIERQKANVVKRVQNEYEAALQREKMTSAAYMNQSHVLANETDQTLQFTALKTAQTSTRDYYNQMVAQYNAALQTAAVPVDNIRVIDPARAFPVPVAPKPTKDLAIGVALGSALAALVVLALEFVRFQRLSRMCTAPGYGTILLNLPELGVVPSVETPKNRVRNLLRPSGSGSEIPSDLNAGRRSEVEPFVAESFRLVLASLLAQKLDLGHTAIMLTSAAAREGKTTVSCNLATAIAETGRRVLLVDADIRNPRLHRIYDVPGEKGLCDLLASPEPLSVASVAKHIVPLPVPGLSLLPSGYPAPEAVGKIFFSDRLNLLMTQLRQDFDTLIIDTPPALVFSDARRIGRVIDGAVVVVRSERTSRDSAQAVAARLAADGIPVLGTVLNDFTPEMDTLYSHVYADYARYVSAGAQNRRA